MMRPEVLLVVLAGALSAGCPSSPPPPMTPSVDEYVIDCESAPDGGVPVASDENLAAFVNAEAAKTVVSDPCKSPQLSAPMAGSKLDPMTPPTFSFAPKGATCMRGPAQDGLHLGCHRAPRGAAPWWAEALIGTAEAHCAAFTGENYWFRLTKAGDAQPVYSAMLSVSSFTPSTDLWKKAMAGRSGQSLALTIERAVFLRGDINEGPYVQPQPISFGVGP